MRISIVTPSFNQAAYLDAAMQSVLRQRDVDLEYVVMDGGSTDGSVDVIRAVAARLVHWESQPDSGQYDAVTRGFAHTTGGIMGWLNSDDLLCDGALSMVREIFEQCPDVSWLTTSRQIRWDDRGYAVRCLAVPGFSRAGFLRGEHLPGISPFSVGWIQQESTFWRRSLWDAAGGQIGAGYSLAGDFELWTRFYQHAELVSVDALLGGFRFHGRQRSAQQNAEYMAQARRALEACGGRPMDATAAGLRCFGAGVAARLPSFCVGWGLVREGLRVRHDRLTRKWRMERHRF